MNRSKSNWLQVLGPGLLYAGAAVGVSHLVQSTSAGANFGYGLLWAILIANLLKFPFFEFGPRYAAVTGKSLLQGYRDLGKWALVVFLVMTLGTMFIIQGAVTVVTAGIASYVTGSEWSVQTWSGIVLAVCLALLVIGRYQLLDRIMKYVILLLTVTSLVALGSALFGGIEKAGPFNHFDFGSATDIAFLIALLGWMPAPLDISVWHSVWAVTKQKVTGSKPSLKLALLDFKIGYWGTTILAICFVALGALMIHGTGAEIQRSAGKFAAQLIGIYTEALGEWSKPIIATAALTTMFSTTLTCLDAFPRVLVSTLALLLPKKNVNTEVPEDSPRHYYLIGLFATAVGAWFILYQFLTDMASFVNIATIISFLTAPFLAIINYTVVTSKNFPKEHQPGLLLRIVSWFGILFLVGFSLYYSYTLVA